MNCNRINSITQADLENIYHSGIDWEAFRNSTVLISGGNGFLPAYMVESLLFLNTFSYKLRVLVLVRNIEKSHQRFAHYLNDSSLVFIHQDVCDEIKIAEPVDYIIHAASQASPKFYGIDPVGTLSANVLGTINLLEFARKQSLKSFLYFSSGDVYGQVSEEMIPIKESVYGYMDPLDVRSCYGESKRMGENICVSYFHQYKIPTKIVRPFHTYGPGMSLDDGRVFADFVADVLADRDICLHSDGSASRAFCYLSDATIGFFKVLLEGKNGEAYNIGNPNEELSILSLAELLVSLYPEKGLKVFISQTVKTNYIKSPIKRNSPDIGKMNKLAWQPIVCAKDGFDRTIKSFL